MKKLNIKKLTTVAASAAIVATFSAGNVSASENPFGMQELGAGYNVAMSDSSDVDEAKAKVDDVKAKAKEAKCGEGKCGGDKAKEGKCGGDKAKAKAKEAKCGEGKCGEKH